MSPSSPLFLTKKGCSTCTDAKKWLSQHGVEVTVRDLFTDPLDAGEVRQLLNGRSPASLISTKSPRYKALGLADKQLSDDEMIELMGQEPYLIRRPTVKAGEELIIGFDKERLAALGR